MDFVLIIHSFIFRDWGCVRLSAIVNGAAVSVRVQIHTCWMGFVDPVVILSLILWGSAALFSMVAALFSSPTSSAHGFRFLCVLTNTACFLFF